MKHLPVLVCAQFCRAILRLSLIALTGLPAFADSVNFSPSAGNALTPFTVTVEGFIGTNGPQGVSVYGAGISGYCNTTRPCEFQANMGYYSGKQWIVAAGTVNGQNVVVSNYFIVRDAHAYINRTCGTNGTKVIVTGYDFARNSIIYVDSTQGQADVDGRFVLTIPIPEGTSGSYNIIAHDGTRFVTNQFFIGANSACDEDVGHLRELDGDATIRGPGGQPRPIGPGDPIRLGDVITTGPGGRADVTFADGSSLIVAPNGRVEVNQYVFNPANGQNDSAAIGLWEGAFKYVSGWLAKRPDDNVQMNTAYGALGIRGTEFVTRRDPCSTTQEVYLIHGQVSVKPRYSAITNIVDAPATILYDGTNVWTTGLTQAGYDTLKSEVEQSSPVTFASWLVGYFGCTNGNPSATALADPDGDGQNNYAEFLARTDPTTNASVFRVISATREGEGVRLAWKTHGGSTNVVQAATDLGGNYSDISPAFVIPGAADAITNYLDAGAITNAAARFYRVRLGP